MNSTTNKCPLQPLADRVIVEPLEAEEKTPSGLYIPDSAKEKPQKGRVVAVGPGRVLDDGKYQPLSVAVGDLVLYAKWAGDDLPAPGGEKKWKIMSESSILARVVDDHEDERAGKGDE